jgi:hypothetical protein
MRSVAANCLIQEMGRTPTLNLWAAILWALGLFAFHSLGAEISLDSPSTALVTPAEDTNAVLHNPDMGWVLYENYPLDQDPHGSSTMLTLPDDDFPEVDSVALMFSWQDIEPREGIYDFSKVDHAYDYWRKRAKAIQLRLSTESLISWEKRNPPTGKGVPDYVLDKLDASEKQSRKMDAESYTVVDARNPFYREKLSAFLRAVNQHFTGARPVTLIDLRGFGAWGEWHSGFKYPNLESRRTALKGVLDIWSAAFEQQMLALSYSYDPDGPKELYAGPNDRFDPTFTTNYTDFLRFSAFDYALTKTNITFRRDGCGGAVHSNERKLNNQAFLTFDRAPMFGEFLGAYSFVKNGGSNWVSWMIEDALSLHPNYLNLIGWQGADARSFARERPDLIAHGLRHMGYRLVPTQIEYPKTITNGVPFQVRSEWVNRGVGRALRDYQMELFLVQTNQVANSGPYTLPTSRWFKGQTYSAAQVLKLPNVPSGDYELAFVLRNPATQRSIALPLKNGSAHSTYPIGHVRATELR